jgi:hypothetical protein
MSISKAQLRIRRQPQIAQQTIARLIKENTFLYDAWKECAGARLRNLGGGGKTRKHIKILNKNQKKIYKLKKKLLSVKCKNKTAKIRYNKNIKHKKKLIKMNSKICKLQRTLKKLKMKYRKKKIKNTTGYY